MPASKFKNSRKLETNIGRTIRDTGIPPRPTALMEIDREMAKDEPDFTHLARIITADVSLSAALLKTTNSPFFGLDKQVRSVPEALLVLGLRLTVRTIAGISLQRAFEHTPHLERYWDESGTTARVSGWLARRLRRNCWIRPEDAYTFGLFHDCGIPVLMNPFPEYRNVLGQANAEREARFTDVEDRLIGANHADMGALLAESWRLPAETVEGIRHHHRLDELVGCELSEPIAGALPLIALTQLAEHLVYQRTGMGNTFEWDKVADAAMRLLDIDDARIADLLEECHEPISGLCD